MGAEHYSTEIVQLPAIRKGGILNALDSPKLMNLSHKTLLDIAEMLEGELVFIKSRATYTELEVAMCEFKNCYRPVDSKFRCSDHIE